MRPSAVPAAPVHSPPLAVITVAVIPGSFPGPTSVSRMACSAPTVELEKESVGTAGKFPRVYFAAPGKDERGAGTRQQSEDNTTEAGLRHR